MPRINKYPVILIIIILLFALNNYIWIKNNKFPPIGNALQDLFPGINFYLDVIHHNVSFRHLLNNVFIDPFASLFDLRHLFSASTNYIRYHFYIYPPLVPLSYSLFYFIFGPNADGSELMVNVFFLAVAMLSVYGIAKKMSSEKAGLLAAFIFSSFPGIIGYSREVFAEFAVMCLLTMMLLFLLKTDFFKHRKYSVLFGVSLGLTALAKWEFMMSLIGPFLWYLSQSTFFITDKEKTPIRPSYIRTNFFLSIFIGTLISFFWYSVSFQDIIWRLFFSPGKLLKGELVNLPNPFLIHKITFFPLNVVNVYLTFFYFLLLIIVVLNVTYRVIKNRRQVFEAKNQIFHLVFLLAWIVIPYLLLLLLNFYAPSHILPIIPAIAIIISLGVFSFKKIIARSFFISLIVVYGLGSYLHSFFIPVWRPDKLPDKLYKLKLYLSPDVKFSLTTQTDNLPRDCIGLSHFYPPDYRDWKFKEILYFIKKDSLSLGFRPVVLILNSSDTEGDFNCFSFQYYNLLGDYQLFIEPRSNDRSEFPKDRSNFSYVVITSHYDDITSSSLSKIIDISMNFDKETYKADQFKNDFFNKYKLIKEYFTQDYANAKIYKIGQPGKVF